MIGVNHNIFKQLDKDIATQKPNSKEKLDDVAAKTSTTKLCNCRGSEPGKVSADIDAHKIGCILEGESKVVDIQPVLP
jgi:hypothetical protein